MSKGIKHSIRGQIYWSILKDGKIISESRPYSNLILEQGLNFIADFAFADCFKYCAIGSGDTQPNKLDKGLSSEMRRSSQYSMGSSGATLTNNIFRIFRTFTFSSIDSISSYCEIGFSPLSNSGDNLFSKALLKNSDGLPTTVTVNPGETLSVKYELSIEVFDAAKIVKNALPANPAVIKIQKIGLMGVSLDGQTVAFDDTNGANEPSKVTSIFISNSDTAPDQFNSCIPREEAVIKDCHLSNYVAGSFGRSKDVLFKSSERPSGWRSLGVGTGASHGTILVFNSPQSADASKAYLVSFKYFWVHQNESNFSIWLDGDDYLYLNKRTTKINTYSYFAM